MHYTRLGAAGAERPKDNTLAVIEQCKDSGVPLRVTSRTEGNHVVYDVHARTWGEWFLELFTSKEERVEINRRVATAIETALDGSENAQPALQNIRAYVEAGTDLSGALLNQELDAPMQVQPVKADARLAGVAEMRFVVGDPSRMAADTCLLNLGLLLGETQQASNRRPQLSTHVSLAEKFFEKVMSTRSESRAQIPVLEIPRCELPAERSLVFEGANRYVAVNGSSEPVIQKHKAFFLEIFRDEKARGTLVMSMPDKPLVMKGLRLALEAVNQERSSRYERITIVVPSDKDLNDALRWAWPSAAKKLVGSDMG